MFSFDSDMSDSDDDCNKLPELPSQTLRNMFLLKNAKQAYLEQYNFSLCADASKFEIMSKVGQGIFG